MSLKPYKDMAYHPMSEQLVSILQSKTLNSNPLFFRVIIAYYLGVVASQMRTSVRGWAGRGTIPINVYALALSPSGTGKGHSVSTIENSVINTFREVFFEHTFPISAEQHCSELAAKRATRNGTDVEDELIKLGKDFQNLGSLLFSFDAATTPAIKQMRQKVLMANAGSINLQIDEIGANFTAAIEPLTAYLELYDKGHIKDKLIKSSADNQRFERIEGATPANAMMFGTPSKLLDGAKTEDLLVEMLEMGYARRCFFSFTEKVEKVADVTVDDMYDKLFDEDSEDILQDMSDHFGTLADLSLMNTELSITKDTAKYLLTYRLDCERRAKELPESQIIIRSELEHRYFKVLKLAGAYAFVDKQRSIEIEHLEYAMALAEESGKAFRELMTPQRPYEKLARYLASSTTEVTLPDLDQDLPYFRGSISQKDAMINMATAWGYKNAIVIKKQYSDGVMFLKADSIKETNLDEMILSATSNTDMTTGYDNLKVAFNAVHKLLKAPGFHWVSHHLGKKNPDDKAGYRKEEYIIPGFNLLVLDVDGTCQLSTAKMLLKDYTAIYQTTKSHTEETNRFRILLPLNYTLHLDSKDYKELYNNIISDLPFEVDEACSHRSKKWLSNPNADIEYVEGELFDVLPYIPKTTKNDERQEQLKNQSDLDNLERWTINNTGDGNRNNMIHRFAMILVDSGKSLNQVKDAVITLNNKLPDKLSEMELARSIFHTVAQRIVERDDATPIAEEVDELV